LPARIRWLSAFTEIQQALALEVQFIIDDPNNLQEDLADCPVNLSEVRMVWVPILLFSDRCLKKVGEVDPDFPIGGYDDVDLITRKRITFCTITTVFPPCAIKFIKERNN